MCRIPGVLPGLRLHEAQDAYGRSFAFMSTTGGGLHTVFVEYTGDGLPTPERLLGGWVARWRAAVDELRAADLAGVAVTAELTRPGILRFALTYTSTEAPPPGTRRRRAGVRETAVRIGAELPRLCTLLEGAAGGRAVPVTAPSVVYGVRATFDPSVAQLVGENRPRPTLRWRDVSPSTVRESWDHIVHDAATSVTWAMTGLPAEEPNGAFLNPAPGVANSRLQVYFRKAARDGARPVRHRDDPAVALTVTSTAELPDALTVLDRVPQRLARSTRWRLRRVYGGQAAAFAAGAGLGIAVPGQLKPPQALGARR